MDEAITERKLSPLLVKVIAVNLTNLLVFFALVFLVNNISTKASSVKTLHSKMLAGESSLDSEVLKADLEKQKVNIDKMNMLLGGDDTVIYFVQQLEKMRSANVISDFTFAVSDAVPDKLGGIGLPVVVESKGTRENVSKALVDISKLPVLFRPITLAISISNNNDFNINMGGFLYIK